MKYLSFTIKKYRAIDQDLIIHLDKHRLVPIIGINECGKTTILHAIFAFDYSNDSFDKNIRHLQDTNNLYKSGQKIDAKISADIKLSWSEFKKVLSIDDIKGKDGVNSYKRKESVFPKTIVITRNLVTKKYDIEFYAFANKDLNHEISKQIIARLPYILYFDDFRDSFPEEIEIKDEEKDKPEGWVAVVERLFEKTDKNFSIFDLEVDQRERKSIISKVQNALNVTLMKEWQNFKLSEGEALKINIDYIPKVTEGAIVKPAKIKFEILETDASGENHYFYIRDRSKGFFWFFNFVMKLEFNPKIISNDGVDAIYLLDEPGSYLHAAAQTKLCKKLKGLSNDNCVIYCTHSHYLLDPDIIPISSIKITEKRGGNFNIKLLSIYEYNPSLSKNAFQPIYDALRVKPFGMDLSKKSKVVIVEGIYDYYCFEMFLGEDVRYLPSQNADSVIYYISLMIGWNINFNALWDHDEEGKRSYKKAITMFGSELKDKMLLLPTNGRQRKRILQDLMDPIDIKLIKDELAIPTNSSFDKVIATLYYSNRKTDILSKVSEKTKDNFKQIGKLFVFKN